jgi:hypothetical protein
MAGNPGVCRIVDGKTSCQSRFPPSLNLARVVLEDLAANSTDLPEATAAILDNCRDLIDKPIDHSTAEKLGVVMISFVLVSIFLNILSLIISMISEDPWSFYPTCVLAVDTLLIFTSLVLCIAMMNYEGGGYLKGVHGGDFSDRQMIGVAIWMLLAMLIGRVLSNVWLTAGAIMILLPLALVFVLFLVRTRGFFYVVRVLAAS